MFRRCCVLIIGSICGSLAWTAIGCAQEPKPPVVVKKPAGLRVLSGGNSWSTENSAPLCQAAGISGHLKLNKHGLNGSLIEDFTPLLEKGATLRVSQTFLTKWEEK